MEMKNSNGNLLTGGGTVTPIKDLKVRDSSTTIKRGTVVKNIKLTDDIGEIEGRVDRSTIILKTEFLKKSLVNFHQSTSLICSKNMNALSRFRIIAFVEGLSYLVLLFIAMPLKYWANMPGAVRITGMIHGVLFILFIVSLVEVMIKYRWSLVRSAYVFVSSLVPFGTFVVEYTTLRRPAETTSKNN